MSTNTKQPPLENAGFTITKFESYETYKKFDREVELFIVFGEKSSRFGMEYVTWEYSESAGFYWGHYCNKRNTALADYHKRLLDHYDPYGDRLSL